jgi:prepilin-type N-terminal cleavage/methylation domain-containing protein/prepilin-type processing-associated H-X9-DG protein
MTDESVAGGGLRMRARAAFTLIELLVVIAIISILMGLLLPAVQYARESARRTECSNNLRQIGIASTSHHDFYEAFPPSGDGPAHWITYNADGNPDATWKQEAGWLYNLLPFVDQEGVWQGKGDPPENVRDEALHVQRAAVAMATPIDVYFCPSRRAPINPRKTVERIWYKDKKRIVEKAIPHAKNDFSACCYDDNRSFAVNVFRIYQSSGSATRAGFVPMQYGAIGPMARTRNYQSTKGRLPWKRLIGHKDLGDGASQQIFASEKRMDMANYAGFPGNDDQGYTTGWDNDVVSSWQLPPERDAAGDIMSLREQFGSAHRSGLNVLFCDGRVNFIRYGVDVLTWMSLCHRADGRAVDLHKSQ